MKRYDYSRDDMEELFFSLSQRNPGNRRDVEDTVTRILEDVKTQGDQAVLLYTKQLDHVELASEGLEVSPLEIEKAYEWVDPALLKVLEKAAENIRRFHEKQKENSWFSTDSPEGSAGVFLGQKVTPMSRVGVYAPAGSAPLPSTVLMDILPARVAGVKEIILCSPPGKGGRVDPLILACAKIAGATRVFSIGGAQAVGAMAYGTQSIPRVDKIVGPGNIYVAMAKKLVFGQCGIDMIAGPSEVLILADESANAGYVAADLLSQAEHDPLASSILITTSRSLADKVEEAVDKQLKMLSRMDIAAKSIENYGAIVLVESLEEGIALSNRIAPEHLEIDTKDAFSLLPSVINAGAVFLGEYSPEPMGDYFAGPNHTLPTNGTARFFSPLGVYDFVKRTSVISYSKKAFLEAAPYVAAFAESEGLTAHAQAVKIRMEGEKPS